MTYQELKMKQQNKIDNFEGIFFAFNQKQFEEGMSQVGLTTNDTDKLLKIGAGGYILKTREPAFSAMFNRISEELEELKKDDAKLLEALIYEMENHEYGYTFDPTQALESLNLTAEVVKPEILAEAKRRATVEY